VVSRALLVDSSGAQTAAQFDARLSIDESGFPLLPNGQWDEATQLLTTSAKSRTMPGCGSMQSYAWDGARFRLAEASEDRSCRGNEGRIVTWRAKVVRAAR
jgi:Protein of unknown function (DUF1176)